MSIENKILRLTKPALCPQSNWMRWKCGYSANIKATTFQAFASKGLYFQRTEPSAKAGQYIFIFGLLVTDLFLRITSTLNFGR